MPPNALPAPAVDLAALIPTQRLAEPEPEAPVQITPAQVAASPRRLAFLWTLLGAIAGSVIVAVVLLVLLTLLP